MQSAEQTVGRRTQRRMLRMMSGSGQRVINASGGAAEQDSAQSSGDSDVASCAEKASMQADSRLEYEYSNLETWVDWIKRTINTAETLLHKHGNDWVSRWRRRVWTWAHRVAGHARSRWTSRSLSWNPELSPFSRGRRQAHPRKRWGDEICAYLRDKGYNVDDGNWRTYAANEELWKSMEADFARFSE